MQKIIFILSTFSMFQLHAKCNTDAIVYKKETGFGISIGGGIKTNFEESSSVNVPFSINNEPACFKKKSNLKIATETKDDFNSGKFVVTPTKVEFENVPDAHTKQYIFIEKMADPYQLKFYTMNFICSGEMPLSIEAATDNYLEIDLKSKASTSTSVTTVFATGAAAKNIGVNLNPKADEAFTFYRNLFQTKSNQNIDVECCNQKIPSIFSATSIETMSGIEKSIATSFSTVSKNVPNGCAKDFSEKMKNYLLENFQNNESLEPFDISKKWLKDDLTFKWKKKN
jgi:hypothetical protein